MNFHGKRKAVTFSFDDGVTQDRRLAELFNRYGMKCTFNINSDLLGRPGEVKVAGIPVSHNKISPEEAKAVAYAHAGVKESDAHDRSWEQDDGRYEIEFSHDGWEYDYLVSLEGKVLRSHREKDDDHHHSKATQPTQSNESRSDRISAEKALSIALNHAGVTDARDRDVEWDDGRWEVSFESGRTEYEYHISASGSILRWEKEQDD
jgi:uncharacterized membrane protein YkoI